LPGHGATIGFRSRTCSQAFIYHNPEIEIAKLAERLVFKLLGFPQMLPAGQPPVLRLTLSGLFLVLLQFVLPSTPDRSEPLPGKETTRCEPSSRGW